MRPPYACVQNSALNVRVLDQAAWGALPHPNKTMQGAEYWYGSPYKEGLSGLSGVETT
jgi:hypothetical protein